MAHYECKYCDSGFYPVNFNGDQVCNGCGAEWEDCKMEVEDDE